MAPEVGLHLHFEISNDCTKCCPRVFSCCCCESDKDEYLVRRNGHLKPAAGTTKKLRKKANRRLFEEEIPRQIGKDTWRDIRGRVSEISGIDIEDEIEEGKPLTKKKLIIIGKAIDEIILEMSTGSSMSEEKK